MERITDMESCTRETRVREPLSRDKARIKLLVIKKLNELVIELGEESPILAAIIKQVEELERAGYEFSKADASFELLILKQLRLFSEDTFFEIIKCRVTIEGVGELGCPVSEASVKLKVKNEVKYEVSDSESGPVDALDKALRRNLDEVYSILKEVRLNDYEVKVLSDKEGISGKVRVLIESANNGDRWSTIGVSENVIEASFKALVDSFYFFLFKNNGLSH